MPSYLQALYALSVALHLGDPHAALRAAAQADEGWAARDPWLHGVWSLIRTGAPEWLHMTTFVAGFGDEITADQAETMTDHARKLLATTPPAQLTLGRILYHPRAISSTPAPTMPSTRCSPRFAKRHGSPPDTRDGCITIRGYRTSPSLAAIPTGPAAPVIEALGREVTQQEVAVSRVSLISQTHANG